MSVRVFIDTNLLLYAFDKKDKIKQDKIYSFLEEIKEYEIPMISTQSLGEFFNITTKKFHYPKNVILNICNEFCNIFPVCEISKENVLHAMKISDRTQFSYWDSLILAVAIDSGCKKVYSEDLSDGQIVESVEIVNPLK